MKAEERYRRAPMVTELTEFKVRRRQKKALKATASDSNKLLGDTDDIIFMKNRCAFGAGDVSEMALGEPELSEQEDLVAEAVAALRATLPPVLPALSLPVQAAEPASLFVCSECQR